MRTPDATSAARDYFGFGASGSGTYAAVLAPNTGQFVLQSDSYSNRGENFTDIGATTFNGFQADHWYKVQVDWGVGGNITANLYDSDGTTLLSTVTATNNTITSGGLAFREFDNGASAFDSVTLITSQSAVPELSTIVSASIAGLAALGYSWRRHKTKAA